MDIRTILDFRPWSIAGIQPPWNGVPLYEYVQSHIAGAALPDEESGGENQICWIAGAKDGVTSHHEFVSEGESESITPRLLRVLERLVKRPSPEHLSALNQDRNRAIMIAYVEEFERAAVARFQPASKNRLADIGRYLATRGDHRETVKIGIVLVKLFGGESDRQMLEILASHDEFTLFAANALSSLISNREIVLWQVAKRVHGWGRIQVVEQLRGTQNRDIQAWMLRDGFRNQVLNEYLAGLCAETGKLHEALAAVPIDSELLDGAADILIALLGGGPAESIADYQHAPVAIERYISHLANTPRPGLQHLLCIARLHVFVTDEEDWAERSGGRWSDDMRLQFRSCCVEQKSREGWIGQIQSGLASEDVTIFYQADAAAQALNISTWETHFAKVRADAVKSNSWYRLVEQTDEDRIDEVLRFAESALPLSEIASGPSDSLGFGARYSAHRALDWILQDLKRFPLRGWIFLRTGIQSPVVRNRNMTLNALLRWPREKWPQDAEWLLATALQKEPDASLKDRLKAALKAE